jgi:Spy/CpxP family protein refolding chaperone
MMNHALLILLSASLLSFTANAAASGEMPSHEEMWQIIQQQQK